MVDGHSLKWKIGNVEILQAVEIEDNKIFSSFIPEAKAEEIKKMKWLIPNFANESGNLKAQVQSFLLRSNGKNILIDTCNGNGKDRPNIPTWGYLQTNFLEKFTALGISPEKIDFVACTHFHFDHVGWNTKLENGTWVPTFPNAKYLFSKEEYDYWVARPNKETVDDLNGIDDLVIPIVEARLANFVKDDYQLDDNISFMPTPGHTPHHVSVVIESQAEKVIITGDVMHHPCQIVHPEWTTSADTYPDQAVETRRKFIDGVKNTNTLIIGSHFANPVAGRIVSSDAGLELQT